MGALGSLAGRRLAGHFDDRALRRIFAVALSALFILRDAQPEALGRAASEATSRAGP